MQYSSPKIIGKKNEKSQIASKGQQSCIEGDPLLFYQQKRPQSMQKPAESQQQQRVSKQFSSKSETQDALTLLIVPKKQNMQSIPFNNGHQIDSQKPKLEQYHSLKQPQMKEDQDQQQHQSQFKFMHQKSPYYQNLNQPVSANNKKIQYQQSQSFAGNKNLNEEQKDIPKLDAKNLKEKNEELKLRIQTESDYQEEQSQQQRRKKGLGYKKGVASYDQLSPTIYSQPQIISVPSNQNLSSSLINQLLQASSQPLEPTKNSSSKCGILRNYAANTHQGLVRNYNEDRVSIIVNVNNQNAQKSLVNCSYFAVYDGHGGHLCSDYLRDNLHLYIIKDQYFLNNPREAIRRGFGCAENAFIQRCFEQFERSGSCAVSVLIVGDMCYVANVGDSRAVLSADGGKQIVALTRDHKPNDDLEKNRITNAGGKIYQSQVQAQGKAILGPHRVLPGRLSVTRSFGDIEAKYEQFGGKQNVVIAQPEIIQFKIQDNHDFIILASDGIFDKVSNEEVVQIVWETQNMPYFKNRKVKIHEFGAYAIENVMKFSLHRRTLDNITVVLIGFQNLKRNLYVVPKNSEKQSVAFQQKIQERRSTFDEQLNFAVKA